MLARILKAPFLTLIIAVGVFSIMSVGGCPAPQQPQPPSTSEPNEGTTTPGGEEGSGTGEGDRPIEQPDLGEGTSDSGDQFPGEGGETGEEGGAGQGQGEFVLISVAEPSNTIAVRPGAVITVEFRLVDVAGSVNSTNLALWRDDDADGVRDTDAEGNTLDPVWTQAISAVPGDNTATFDTNAAVGLLSDGLGRFLIGVQATTVSNDTVEGFSPATITIDSVEPTATWVSPLNDELVTRNNNWTVEVQTSDNAPHTVRILLDPDQNPESGNEFELIAATEFPAGSDTRTFTTSLAGYPAGLYYYYVIVSDGIEPPVGFYGENAGALVRLRTTNRLVGDFDLNSLENSSDGAILQGFEFNDLAGSSMTGLPDVNGDGGNELVIAARYGKPYIINDQGVGFGEAYLIYSGYRLHGVTSLNSVGRGSIEGLVFPGIRFKMNEIWSEGMSDVTYVPDMDGDGLPELVFGFSRVESLSLAAAASVNGVPFQHPELVPDLPGMGSLEYDAINYSNGMWTNGVAQFTRGGIVIVSSHNTLLKSTGQLNRKGNRVIDLHEVGQLFNSMSPPSLQMYVRKVDVEYKCWNCEADEFDPNTGECTSGCGCELTDDQDPNETVIADVDVAWDNYFSNQPPGGFLQTWNIDSLGNSFGGPALANARVFGLSLPDNDDEPCDDGCKISHRWYGWYEEAMCMLPMPGTSVACGGGWQVPLGMSAAVAWTGFYGPDSRPKIFTNTGKAYDAPIGARILGEETEDRFGVSVSADDTWLYIAAPEHSATTTDVPALASNRNKSGVVYMYRVNMDGSQLWIEGGTMPDPNDPNILIPLYWPRVDAENYNRFDYTMPVPHQYVIETVGSVRGPEYRYLYELDSTECTSEVSVMISDAENWYSFYPYPPDTCGYLMDRTPQIVGPHPGAKLSFVKAIGDINGDGINDFAVGSPDVKSDVANGSGETVGALFIVYGRSTGLEGDYLLERMALAPGDANRLHGVLLKGSSADAKLARVIDAVGDFNGDGYNDVIVGSEGGGDSGEGEAIVIFGSPTLESPEGGWTVSEIVAAGRALRFVGVSPGDLTGANVAGAGDVDSDGLGDILIAAPGVNSNEGAVYLIYGSSELVGEYSLADVGTVDLPGATFLGRNAGDMLGGGTKDYTGTSPVNPAQTFTAYSRGVVGLGDIDGDGNGDIGISAILADPTGKTDAGEVYIIYGRHGP